MVMEKGGWAYGQAQQDPTTYPLWIAGRFYGCPYSRRSSSAATGDAGFWAIPIYAPGVDGAAIDQIGIEICATGTATGVMRLGIYDDKEGVPWDLMLDAGTVDIAHTGFQSIAVALRLRGWAWLAMVTGVYAVHPSFRILDYPVNYQGYVQPKDYTVHLSYLATGGWAILGGGLPARYPIDMCGTDAAAPRILVRAA